MNHWGRIGGDKLLQLAATIYIEKWPYQPLIYQANKMIIEPQG
jgi:hypothetical protein